MAVQERYRKYVSDQREFFDTLITDDWDTYLSPEWDDIRRFEIERLFRLVQPKRVLDVGCGCGFHDREMALYSFVDEVHGVDYSTKSIEAAERHYPHEKVRRWAADFLRDDFEGGYDLVVSFQVFEHVDVPERFIERCAELLRPGGHCAILTPNRLRLTNVLRRMRALPYELCDPQHYREYSLAELRALCERAGLSYVSSFGYGLNGVSFIDRKSVGRRLELGVTLPWIANCFCLLTKKKS